jgi:hypothetical protein
VEIADSGSFVSPEGLWRVFGATHSIERYQPGPKQMEFAAAVHFAV